MVGTGSVGNPYVVSANTKISNASDNIISCTPEGLYAQAHEKAQVEVLSTPCFDFDISGNGAELNPYVITGNPIISIADGNNLLCTDQGLFVGPAEKTHVTGCVNPNASDCPPGEMVPWCADTVVTGMGTESNPYVVCTDVIVHPSNENLLSCTPQGLLVTGESILGCIAGSVGGGLTCNGTSLSVCISTDNGNALSWGADGCLYVATPGSADGSETRITSLDSSCVDTEVSGVGTSSDPYVVSASLKLADNCLNLASCTSEGLRVSPTAVRGFANDCILTTVFGTGCDSDPYLISVTPVISECFGNSVECKEDGFFVPAVTGSETNIIGEAGTCHSVNVSGLGTATAPYIISGETHLNPSLQNQLVCTAEGLYVGPQDGAQTIIQVSGSSCIDNEITGGGTDSNPYVIYTKLNVSSAANNNAECRSDGVYVGAPSLNVSDSNCFDLTLIGDGTQVNPWLLDGDIRISNDPNNAIVCTTDGLFVPAVNIETADSGCLQINLAGLGTSTNPYVITGGIQVDPSSSLIYCGPNGLTVDCESVQDCVGQAMGLGLDYDDSNDLYHVKLSQDSNNCVSYGSDGGIYVACGEDGVSPGAASVIQVEDTSCINTDLVGAGTSSAPYVISSSLQISGNAHNSIKCTDSGIFSPYTAIEVNSGPCNKLAITGAGTPELPFILESELCVSPLIGNSLICTEDGLFSKAFSVDVIDTSCISLDMIEQDCGNYVISATPVIKPCPDNAIFCTPEGLYVHIPEPPRTSISAFGDGGCLDLWATGSGVENDPYLVSGTIKISEAEDNALVCIGDGLFVELPSLQDLDCEAVKDCVKDLIVTQPNVFISDNNNNCLVVGTDGGLMVPCNDTPITLSEDNDNCIIIGSDGGIFVECPETDHDHVLVSADANNNITVGVDGGAFFELEASADVGNCLTVGTDGKLFAPCPVELSLDDQNCLGIGTDGGFFIGCIEGGGNGSLLSTDPNNCATSGSDGGLFVPCPEPTPIVVMDSDCIDMQSSGTGTSADPYVISASPVIASGIECTPDGMKVCFKTEIEIGQDGCLDDTPLSPAIWRAPRNGFVSFDIAHLALNGSTNAGPTNYEIIDENGTVVHAGSIAAGQEFSLIDVGPLPVAPGGGFAAWVVAPYQDPAAIGLTVRGEYKEC